MGGFMSPLDPVFWTHHNQVEHLWVQWNVTRGNPNTSHGDWTGTRFTEFFDGDGRRRGRRCRDAPLSASQLSIRHAGAIAMFRAFDEPTTQEEAQELRLFMERAADVRLETIRQFVTERSA
jgi:tyrosinase